MSSLKGSRDPRHYRVGIDVGTHSVGLAAVEYDSNGSPVKVLSAVSHLHDSGVLEHKTASTRLAASGVARRMRRLRRRRIKRLEELDRKLAEWGWGESKPSRDPYFAWRTRARLATERISDETERNQLLAVALRHMARHRGWRNPYTRVDSLLEVHEPSDNFKKYKDRVIERTGRAFDDDVAVSELAVAAIDFDQNVPLRSGKTFNKVKERRTDRDFSYLGGALYQVDNANEVHAYAEMQGFSEELTAEIVRLVFKAESPRGSWAGKIGKDPFDQQDRASKATDAFQRQRIIEVLSNVKVKIGSERRWLTVDERQGAFAYLFSASADEEPTWQEVGAAIGLPRSAMVGVASLDDDQQERLPLRPPVHVTNRVFEALDKKLAPVREHWAEANQPERDALVTLLMDGQTRERTPEDVSASEFLNTLPEEALVGLDDLALPAGRSSYSVNSLRKLTDHMLATEDHLHTARMAVFGVDDKWVPPSEPIGAPIGNPAVDRVTKIVSRWLAAAESQWGVPAQITIEHVREAFMSEAASRQREKEMQTRFEANEKTRLEIKSGDKDGSRVTNGDLRRYEAIRRQKGECIYCGETITFTSSQMDHIVPRAGTGSTSTRTNLVAACVSCNASKGNLPFAVWAKSRAGVSVEEAVNRTKFWTRDSGTSSKSWGIFLKEVRERLSRTDDDPEIDVRSLESVAWMANELRDRIAGDLRFSNSKVRVYQGRVTAGARGAAGIEGKVPLVGGKGKTRLDRRHHIVDAAVLTLLDESVGKTLAERNNLRWGQQLRPDGEGGWRSYEGASETARQRFTEWKNHMQELAQLLTADFAEDRAVVMESLRLRLPNGKVHDDTISPLVRRHVGDAMSREEIDAASSPALWTALTRLPDFDPVEGLPENSARQLRVHGSWFDANDEIGFFDKPRAAIAVRGGWAALGDSIHHARIYKREERGKANYGMLRVFSADLARHRREDLFAVEPDPSWISVRTADPKIAGGLWDFEELGWLVAGDELEVDVSSFDSGHIGRFREVFGDVQRWRIAGFEQTTKLALRPATLASEGLDRLEDVNEECTKSAAEIMGNKGWRVAINQLLLKGNVSVIRRDALGRPRFRSAAGLPVSWRVE